jgi:hypothetical protein
VNSAFPEAFPSGSSVDGRTESRLSGIIVGAYEPPADGARFIRIGVAAIDGDLVDGAPEKGNVKTAV